LPGRVKEILVVPATRAPLGARAGVKRNARMTSSNFFAYSRSLIGGSTWYRSTRPSALTQNVTFRETPRSSFGGVSKGKAMSRGSGGRRVPPSPPPPMPFAPPAPAPGLVPGPSPAPAVPPAPVPLAGPVLSGWFVTTAAATVSTATEAVWLTGTGSRAGAGTVFWIVTGGVTLKWGGDAGRGIEGSVIYATRLPPPPPAELLPGAEFPGTRVWLQSRSPCTTSRPTSRPCSMIEAARPP
jgi:hypothetical protein